MQFIRKFSVVIIVANLQVMAASQERSLTSSIATPQGDEAENAYWEALKPPPNKGAECGCIRCMEIEFELIEGYLKKYPTSPRAVDAVKKMNEIYESNLGGKDEPGDLTHFVNEDCTVEAVTEGVQRYEDDVKNLSIPAKDLAYEEIAQLWYRLDNQAHAKELYEAILRDDARPAVQARIKGRLSKIKLD